MLRSGAGEQRDPGDDGGQANGEAAEALGG